MTILFAGGRLESLVTIAGAPADVRDTYQGNPVWDPNYSDAALQCASAGVVGVNLYDGGMAETSVGPGHTFWFHSAYFSAGMHGYAFLYLYSLTGAQVLRLFSDGNGNFVLQANTGTAGSPVWTDVGSPAAAVFSSSAISRMDLEVQMPGSGEYVATLYLNESATAASGSFTPGTDAGQPAIAQVQLNDAGQDLYYSQILATSDQSTVGAHVKTCRATAAGNYQQWTGGYTNVNEPLDNDSTADQATAAGLKQTYPMGNVTVPTGYAIASVFHWLRAKNDGGAPENIESACIIGGSEYESGNLGGIGVGYGPVGARYDTNPNTSATWTEAEWNTPVQLGYVSET